MCRIENQNLYCLAVPMLFIGASYFAGSTRLIQYFPGASRRDLILSAVLGSTTVVGSKMFRQNYDLERLIYVIGSLALSTILTFCAAKALKGGSKMSIQASFRFAVVEAAIVGGLESIPHLLHSKPLKENCPKKLEDPKGSSIQSGHQKVDEEVIVSKPQPLKENFPEVLEAFQGISIESSHRRVVEALVALDGQHFFENKDHERSKQVFREAMQHFGLSVTYVDAKGWDYEAIDGELDLSIFQWSRTDGVEQDIPKAANDKDRVHLFSVASQYNAAEAPNPFTPPIGTAILISDRDSTQGPLAQRTNFIVFELVTAFLTHVGFNMMHYVLPSAGTTYTEGSAIEHGYLRPTKDTIFQLAKEMEWNFRNLEVPCYESRPTSSGQSVFLMLGAAPALGYSFGLDGCSVEDCEKLQLYAYMANLTAQFKHSLQLLEENPDKEVVLHITGTGLGVFGCKEKIFAQAFKSAALEFQKRLKPSDKGRMHVQLESHYSTFEQRFDKLQNVGQNLLLLGSQKPRIE